PDKHVSLFHGAPPEVIKEKLNSSEILSETAKFLEGCAVLNLLDKPVYRFEDVEIDIPRGVVRRGGQEVHLRQQTFQVLLYLLERRERLVTKEELFENIWRETAV